MYFGFCGIQLYYLNARLDSLKMELGRDEHQSVLDAHANTNYVHASRYNQWLISPSLLFLMTPTFASVNAQIHYQGRRVLSRYRCIARVQFLAKWCSSGWIERR